MIRESALLPLLLLPLISNAVIAPASCRLSHAAALACLAQRPALASASSKPTPAPCLPAGLLPALQRAPGTEWPHCPG